MGRNAAVYWPDIEKSRAEARRLLKEAGAEDLCFELLNRNVDQPFKYVATWLIDAWNKIGLHVTHLDADCRRSEQYAPCVWGGQPSH